MQEGHRGGTFGRDFTPDGRQFVAGDHEQAIDEATTALNDAQLDATTRAGLLDARAASRLARADRTPQRIATMPPARSNPISSPPVAVGAVDPFRASGPPSYEAMVERTQLGIPTAEALARGQGHLPGVYPSSGGFSAPPTAPAAPEPKKKPWFALGLVGLFLAAIGAVFVALSLRGR